MVEKSSENKAERSDSLKISPKLFSLQNSLNICHTMSLRFKEEFLLFCNFITGEKVERNCSTTFLYS